MQGVAEAECRRAADAAEAAYKDTFRKEVAADEGSLEQEHLRALAAAQHAFSEVAVGEQRGSLHELRLDGVCCCVVHPSAAAFRPSDSCYVGLHRACSGSSKCFQAVLEPLPRARVKPGHPRAAGESSIKQANEQRFRDRVSSSYQLFRKERLATAELECRKLIQEATTQLTQVCQHVPAPLGWIRQP